MAARQGQGLQIAVIVFAMLTIILAITTYIFFAQATTAQKDADAKNKQLADAQLQSNKLRFQLQAMRYALGMGGVTLQEVDVAKQAAGGDDKDAKEVLDNFAQDMALVGDQAAPEGPKNYRTLATILLKTIAAKNSSIADANEQTRNAQREKDTTVATEKTRADTASAAALAASEDQKKEHEQVEAERNKMKEDTDKLVAQIASLSTKSKTELDKVMKERETFVNKVQTSQNTIESLQERIKAIEKEEASLFENPDGRITKVNQALRLVYINLGRADGLARQTTFSVYDHDINGVTNAKSKGRIEVVSVSDHEAEGRILDDKPGNPIINGDVIFTPAWSPGQRVHFAMALKMDINKDGIDDYDMVKKVIEMNGGIVDAELRADGKRRGNCTINTRYFVRGETPTDAASGALLTQLTDFEGERIRNGVEPLSVDKLLDMMGWKAEERTVELAGNRAGGDFRKRTPGKTQPAAAPASTSETPATTAAPASVDPFSSPAASPTAADPFAPKPEGKAAPTNNIDPFAAPK